MKFYIGVDESGKGDYFGPLVIAGVLTNEKINEKLKEIGVKDSKKISDKKIFELAEEVKNFCDYKIVVINPKRYNELSKRLNLNKLLAWGHARVIEDLMQVAQEKGIECEYALSDQFGDERFLQNALMEKGKKIKLFQRHRAEDDLGVASASILARAEFLERLSKLSVLYGVEFPKGASEKVIQTARVFINRFGREKLSEVAKVHFRTTNFL